MQRFFRGQAGEWWVASSCGKVSAAGRVLANRFSGQLSCVALLVQSQSGEKKWQCDATAAGWSPVPLLPPSSWVILGPWSPPPKTKGKAVQEVSLSQPWTTPGCYLGLSVKEISTSCQPHLALWGKLGPHWALKKLQMVNGAPASAGSTHTAEFISLLPPYSRQRGF